MLEKEIMCFRNVKKRDMNYTMGLFLFAFYGDTKTENTIFKNL